jgi:cysteine-rich repeat protein
VREAGGEDHDGDGMLDDALDADADGLADSVQADTGVPLPLPDLNRNGVPDYRDSLQTTESGGHDDGCAVAPPRSTSSALPYALVPIALWIWRATIRRRVALGGQVTALLAALVMAAASPASAGVIRSCGDGITDPGEQCDSGNTADGACCDSACHFKVEGTECGSGLCDFGSATAPAPASGHCARYVAPPAARCSRSDDTDPDDPDDELDVVDAGDRVYWKWRKGPAARIEDYADPGRTSTFALCIYAGVSTKPRMAFNIPPSATFWKTHISHVHNGQVLGFTYKDRTGSADGVNSLLLRVGAQNKSHVAFRAQGPNLPDPPVGPLPFPVTVQLVNNTNNVCFQSVFSSAAQNDPDRFKATTP